MGRKWQRTHNVVIYLKQCEDMMTDQESYCLDKNRRNNSALPESNVEISIDDVIERDLDKSYLSEFAEEEQQEQQQRELEKYALTKESSNAKNAKTLAWHNFIQKKKTIDPQYVSSRRIRERERLRKKRESRRRKQLESAEYSSKDCFVTSIHSLTHSDLDFPEKYSSTRKSNIQEQLCVTEERIRNLKQLLWENLKYADCASTKNTCISSLEERVRDAMATLESAERNLRWLSKQLENFTAAVDNLSHVVESVGEKMESSLLLHQQQSIHPFFR